MKEKIYKNITEFVFYQHLLLGTGLDLRCGLYTQLDSIVGKECFVCKQLSLEVTFCLWLGAHVYFLLLAPEPYLA